MRPAQRERKRSAERDQATEELIRLGAYKAGTNPEVDEAVRLYPQLEAFLAQSRDERATLSQGYDALSTIMGSAQGSAR